MEGVMAVRFTEKRIREDIALTGSPGFIEKCRSLNKKHFTRNRKMPLGRLLLSILNRRGLTLSLELRKFKELVGMKEKISKQGYLKQRMKLNPDAIMELCRYHNKGLYEDGGMKTLNGYYILAADGSGVNVPTTRETLDAYGTSSRKGTKPQASLGISCLYDVLNHTILECSIHSCKFDEMKEAYAQVRKAAGTIGGTNSVLVLDRGYPSSAYFIKMLEEGQKFLVRLKSSDFKKEQQAMGTQDEDVDIFFDPTRIRHYAGTETGDKMTALGSIRMRFVKIALENGVIECLATNLPESEFALGEIGRLYAARWGIETAYDMLKNNLELENFTGTKPALIAQDIYSSVYLCNLAQDMVADADAEQQKENEGKYKHEMTVNKTYAVGVLKEELIRAVLEKDPHKKSVMFHQMVAELKKNLIPIRNGRHYKRTKGNLAAKYSNTHKRSY